jgi:ribosomal protein S18 acetylase RimI-like enzyme
MTSPTLTHLPWDSDFFGVSVARADIDEAGVEDAVREAIVDRVQCLYLFVKRAEPIAIAEAVRRGGRIVDLRVELDLHTPVALPSGIRRAERRDATTLFPLAQSLARESRFSADPHFAGEAVRAMYGIWLEQCLDEGLVIVPDHGIRGFVGARTSGDTISIDLVYVDEHARGQGLAGRLVAGAIALSGARGGRVATQASNIAAQRLYQALGFRTASLQAIVHLWLDDSTTRSR